MRVTLPPPQRLGDLWWLLAHDERGRPHLGQQHFAIGLAACALGEVLTQPGGRLSDDGDVLADPVAAHVLGELTGAAARGYARPPRVWVEWLAEKEQRLLAQNVVARMVAGGLLVRTGRQLAPADTFTAFAPVTALMSALGSGYPVAESIRLLAGVANGCGLAPLVASGGQDMVRALQLLAMELPKPVYALVTAVEDAVHALATRRR